MYPKNWRLQGKIGGSSANDAVANRLFPAVYRTQPALADPDGLLADQATDDAAITTVLAAALLAQPDVPRQLEVLPGGTTTDVPAGDVTITGTDIAGNEISEALTFAANASTKQTTVAAFKTVESIVFPIQDGPDATYDFGTGAKVGVPHILKSAAMKIQTIFDGSTDAGTWTIDADEIEKNVYAAAGTFDGAKWLELFYYLGTLEAV